MNKISVIIPVYNGENYIDVCLNTLINQTFKNIEVIFVDDGSTDRTPNIIKKYAKKYDYIKYVYEDNGRQGKARNNGLKHATGNYIHFLDCDDFVDFRIYEEINNNIEKYHSDIIMFDYYITYTTWKQKYITIPKYNNKNNISKREYFLSTPSPWNKVIRKDFLINNSLEFKENMIYEDYALIPTFAVYNPKITYVDKPLLYYVQSENSTTRNETYKQNYVDIFKATESLYNDVKSHKELKSELEYVITYHFLHEASLLFFKFGKYEEIDKISDFMHDKFPKFKENKYFKEHKFKFKLICNLFYNKNYDFIVKMQKIKRGIKR